MKRIFLVCLILLLGLFSCGCLSSESYTSPEEGKMAPDFELETLSGEKAALSDFRGKPVLLVFWATT